MAKTIEGTKDRKKAQARVQPQVKILKVDQNDARKIRCTKCGDLTNAMPDGKGGNVATCPSCGTQFSSTPI